MKHLKIVLSLAVLLAQPLLAAERGPSTPEERERVVELARLLEEEPWSEEAPAAREWLLSFLSEVPDLTVKLCLSLLGPPAEREAIPDSLRHQQMFSSAAFQIENPEVGAGSTAALLAGLEGTLRAYEGLKSHDAIEELSALEALLRVREEGNLETYVRGQGRACR